MRDLLIGRRLTAQPADPTVGNEDHQTVVSLGLTACNTSLLAPPTLVAESTTETLLCIPHEQGCTVCARTAGKAPRHRTTLLGERATGPSLDSRAGGRGRNGRRSPTPSTPAAHIAELQHYIAIRATAGRTVFPILLPRVLAFPLLALFRSNPLAFTLADPFAVLLSPALRRRQDSIRVLPIRASLHFSSCFGAADVTQLPTGTVNRTRPLAAPADDDRALRTDHALAPVP